MIDRRDLLKTAALGTLLPTVARSAPGDVDAGLRERLVAAQLSPVLRRERLREPIIIDTVELLNKDDQFFVRIRSTDGVEGIALTNRRVIRSIYPMLPALVMPHFVGKDARDLDALIEGVFVRGQNYKWQGLGFWSCVAWVEFAILDLIGNYVGAPVGALLGERIRDRTAIYYANGDRTSEAAAVVGQLEELIAISGARALKFKLGARMHSTDASTRRDFELIPLARKRLGYEITLFTDSNSSFDVPLAVRIGRLLEAHDYDFFEEPVQFDHFEETRAVADALEIAIAGGEQEYSMRRFQWLIENRALQILQPDLLFFGGFVRSIRVARMAEAAGLRVVPHMSGFGLGSLHVLHFASVVPNSLEYQEYKGDKDGLPYEVIATGEPLRSVDGEIEIPSGPGFGVRFDPDYMRQLRPVRT